ncbi:MAG: putative cytochrome c [Candidatus Syntrophoarchaeum sp. GoM_oil]|nr:MAG: putative cytochrome c [Candidatus Syntrophoarchaeum sp. GoM_oil]
MAVVLSIWAVNSVMADETPDFGGCEGCHPEIAENFATSLHYTTRGMPAEWKKGAAGHFGIDMDAFFAKGNCSKCHVSTCEKCHEGGHGAEITIDTCDKCHKKKQAGFVGDTPAHKGQGPNADIHYEKGLICTDCHTVEEMHGTGVKYRTMLEAVTTECEDCHESPGKVVKAMPVTQYDPGMKPHSIHEGKLDCTACHSGWTPTCANCHIDINKPPGKATVVTDKFYLARGVDGKIKPFLKIAAIYNNETHTGWAEWFPHTTTKEAKDCAFCHENKEVLCEGCEDQTPLTMLGPGGSFISQETIDRIYGISTIPAETATEVPATATPEETSTPGFEVVICIGVLAIAAYLGKRR